MRVEETFCVPHMCNNYQDKANLLMWYETFYVRRRSGWLLAWDKAALTCPGIVGPAAGWTAFGLTLAAIVGSIANFCFVAPKERGRTMITQEQMAVPDDASDASN